MKKPVLLVSHQVIHKPSCSSRETTQRLEISDIETREIFFAPQIEYSAFFTNFNKAFLAPQIEYSAFFTRFNKAYLLSLYKINFLTRGSDKNQIASQSP